MGRLAQTEGLTEEQQAILEAVRDYVDNEIIPAAQELEHADEYPQEIVDGLKEINDTLGHRAGDAALRTLAGRFTDAVRDGDSVARMGGDEFLVLLEGVHDETEAPDVAEKIRKVAEAPVVVGGHLLRTTVSIGVALARPGETADDVVARADRAMYTAKQTGRNRVHSLDRPASDGAAPAGSYASE